MGKGKKKGDKQDDGNKSSQQQVQNNPQKPKDNPEQLQPQQPRENSQKAQQKKCSNSKESSQDTMAGTSQQTKPVEVQQPKPQEAKEEAQKPQAETAKKADKNKQGKGVWFCSKCEQKNFDRFDACKKCKLPRPKEVVADPTPSPSQMSREQTPQLAQSSSSTSVPDIQNLQISGAKKISGLIESNPNGQVYEGKRGKKCKVEVNYATINFVNLPKACYHYDVTFIPEVPKKMLPAALHEFMRTFFKTYVYGFDGRKNMYTNQLLHIKGNKVDQYSEKVEAHLGDRSRVFEIKIKLVSEVDMGVLLTYKDPKNHNIEKPGTAIQALDIILRSAFRRNIDEGSAIPTGKAVFFVPNRKSDLGDGMELWLGLFQSAILGRAKIYLNVDVLHKAFPSAVPVLELLRKTDRSGNISDIPKFLNEGDKKRLKEFLQMLSVGYRLKDTEPYKTFGFNGIGDEASKVKFEHNGRQITIQQYFEKEKKMPLKYPDLPVLWVGSKVKRTYLPIEFCVVPPGQATNKKCSPNVTKGLIRYSATSTEERKRKIRELLDKINYGMDPTIKGFGIQVDKKFEMTEARVIDPPNLKYRNNVAVTPIRGVWKEERFLEVNSNKIKWCILNADSYAIDQRLLMNLKDELIKESSRQGIFLENMTVREIVSVNLKDRKTNLEDIFGKMKNDGYGLILAVINDFDNAYARVKQAAELSVGILTQCIKSNTVKRINSSTLKNIILKLNAKLNGKNHEIEEISYQSINSATSGVMFVGADVTHPSPDQRNIPSVVGVASSHDQVGFRYCCAWRLQNPKEEMIGDLENILVEHLKFYAFKNGNKLPAKIMYYRDGVSDGQFKEVLEREMTAIRGALRRMYGLKKHAAVTFIVVQKRHHTRFFPTDKKFSDGRNNNVLPGTVVDKDIVHPFQYQFFLASHAAIQGVAKPTKYCILVNESNIQPDDLQAVTYDLCHLFTRCSRSVSYPAPTYYAHLVAARGKNYIIGRTLNMDKLQDEYRRLQINPGFVQNTPMFFV
ncbi:protein argonaute-2 [Chironomus tepperi]|uniref:protein argonaute-2 n=1 Tax=Chironomus tepperi TaxID=113505 RepID=UPI00391F9EC9